MGNFRAKFGIIALTLLSTPSIALAGQQYCSDAIDTYYVEHVPFGYAFVHGAYADFCKRDHMSDDPHYICDGNPEYKILFKLTGKSLTVTQGEGKTVFKACKFANSNADKSN